MPDITMCSGQGCPLKDDCTRARAKAGMYQSFFMKPPIKDGECDHHWPVAESPYILRPIGEENVKEPQ